MTRSRTGEAISARGRSPSARKKLRRFIRKRAKAGDLAEWRRGRAVLGYIEGRRVIELAAELDVTRGAVAVTGRGAPNDPDSTRLWSATGAAVLGPALR